MLCMLLLVFLLSIFFFFFNDTATTEIYTLSLHDALPISIAYPTTKIRVNATCRKCPHKVHRMEMKTLPTGSEIGRAVQQECRDRSRMPSAARKKKRSVKSLLFRSLGLNCVRHGTTWEDFWRVNPTSIEAFSNAVAIHIGDNRDIRHCS